jgi:predicted nucleotidyltransferase
MITRDELLIRIETGLKDHPQINAMWLEGADGTGSSDQYSDLDLVIDVEDGFETEAFSQLEDILTKQGSLDLAYEEPLHHSKLRYKVYHLEGTQDSLFLDVTVQSHSRNFKFVKENESEVPSVIFDKKGVIQFQSLNREEWNRKMYDRLYHLENTVNQKARAMKYVKRNKFIEAVGYYQKFVVTPLIELLRIKYRPVNYDYYIVSISKHLPPEVLKQVEELFKIHSIDEIGVKMEQAHKWFHILLKELRNELMPEIDKR